MGGGYRTIHFTVVTTYLSSLLALVDKGERDNLFSAERNALADELAELADDYRAGVAARLATLKWRT